MAFEGEAADDGAGCGVDGRWLALEHDGGAGLREGGFAEYEEAAARAVGSLAKAEPGGEGNAPAVLYGFVGEVEDDSGEAAGLEEKVSGAKRLVEASPGLCVFCSVGLRAVGVG